jgi:hypothetical protein
MCLRTTLHAQDMREIWEKCLPPCSHFPNFDLFAKIATAMMTDPNTAVLKMEDVEKLGETTAMRREIRQSLLNLFKVKDKKDKIKDKKGQGQGQRGQGARSKRTRKN